MCNNINGKKFVCLRVEFLTIKFDPQTDEFLTINVLLHTKSEQKVIGISICTPIIFKDPLKPGFSIRNIVLQFVSGVFGL